MSDTPSTHIYVKARAGLHLRLSKVGAHLVVTVLRKTRRALDLDVVVCMFTAPIASLAFTKVSRGLGNDMSLWIGGGNVIELPQASAQKAAAFLGTAFE